MKRSSQSELLEPIKSFYILSFAILNIIQYRQCLYNQQCSALLFVYAQSFLFLYIVILHMVQF